jgi:hypothetical protein
MNAKNTLRFREAIHASGLDIYAAIAVAHATLWIPTPHLEALLNQALTGLSLSGYALRTRSKVVKQAVCAALGYPVPKSFKKSKPQFFGQQLDTYTQKSNNLQIWNEDLSPTRRYAIIQLSDENIVLKVKIVDGLELARLDTTGTITSKYQARLVTGATTHELISAQDTLPILQHVNSAATFAKTLSPIAEPKHNELLPITEIFGRLSKLVGLSFADPGIDQERNRGAALHRLICECLTYSRYEDQGQFPDVRHQLLEVKLQTSPTIDLGMVLPNSEEPLDMGRLGNHRVRHCDTRYAMFYAKTNGQQVTLTHLFVTTGADFFTRFKRFEGKVKNGKIQIPLPKNFFSS